MNDLRPRRWKRNVLIALAVLVAAYAILGFFVAPGIVRRELVKQASAVLHREVSVGRVAVNPFALSLTVDSLRAADKDGSTLLAWDEFYINFELISILKREFTFSEIRLLGPYARIAIRPDGTMNVSDIIDSLNARPKPANPAPAPVIAIGALHIGGAHVDLLDSSAARPFATTVGPWRIDLQQFATRSDNHSQYSFAGRTESGETFSWAGTFAIDPVRSAGEFSLDSIRLAKYGPLYEHTVGFDVVDGVGAVRAKYAVDLTPKKEDVRLTEGALRVDRLALAARGRPDTSIQLQRLEISGVDVHALQREARVGAIALQGGRVHVVRGKDGTINLIKLAAAEPQSRPARSAPAPRPPAAPPKPAPAWRWAITRIAADSFAVNVTDSAAGRPARFAITGLSAAVDSIASDTSIASRVRAALTWQGRGTFSAQGTVNLWRRQGDLTLTAANVAIGPFDAYLAPRANLLISDGALSATAKLHFDLADSLKSDMLFTGDARVDHFATVDGVAKAPFFSFRSLRFTGIDYAQRKSRLAMKAIALDAPDVEITLLENGKRNTDLIFPASGAPAAAADSAARDTTARDSAARDTTAPPAQVATAPAKGDSAARGAPAMHVSIGGVRVTSGRLRITDRSIQPPVALSVDKMDVTTGRLSTDSLGVGTLEMTAAIDDVAPLKVSGRFNPLSDKEGSDLTIDMQGMEMVPLGPYFGKHLGYGISTGKMKLVMKYQVQARKLKSQNKLTLDGFEWGEATNSPDATKMPVKLAFSVMRDRSGQIVFDVPVEGNLDDPSFRLGRVIGRAFMDILTRIATSPFKLLGAMGGGESGADLSYVQFSAGADTLTASARSELAVLAKALYERPALKLQIAGSVDTAADRAGIQRVRLEARLRTIKWTELKAQGASVGPADSLHLTPADRAPLLASAFATAFPKDSAVLSTKGKKGAMPYPSDVMEQRLLPTIAVTADDLQLLAGARAKVCLDYLLNVPTDKIEPERVLLTGGAMKTEGARAAFTLQ